DIGDLALVVLRLLHQLVHRGDRALRGIMNDFEAKNPGIKVTLVSGPYATTRDQIVVGAASGTLSDVVGIDGAWVNGLAK
ncbi:extracellular solute-binding protein, partial [Rhizobium ruizarguesonis]